MIAAQNNLKGSQVSVSIVNNLTSSRADRPTGSEGVATIGCYEFWNIHTLLDASYLGCSKMWANCDVHFLYVIFLSEIAVLGFSLFTLVSRATLSP